MFDAHYIVPNIDPICDFHIEPMFDAHYIVPNIDPICDFHIEPMFGTKLYYDSQH